MKKVVFLLLLTMWGRLALADCSDKRETVELKQCFQQEYEKADKELNNVYQQLSNKLDPDGKEKLKKVQRAWLQFRDLEAQFSADRNRGGTFGGVVQLGTLGDLTNQRIKGLKDQLDLYK